MKEQGLRIGDSEKRREHPRRAAARMNLQERVRCGRGGFLVCRPQYGEWASRSWPTDARHHTLPIGTRAGIWFLSEVRRTCGVLYRQRVQIHCDTGQRGNGEVTAGGGCCEAQGDGDAEDQRDRTRADCNGVAGVPPAACNRMFRSSLRAATLAARVLVARSTAGDSEAAGDAYFAWSRQ
jgi:hypothetical protein